MADHISLFKQAMRQLGGGVCVVTTGQGAERSGFTATSVTSLSAEPPSLLACLYHQSATLPVLEASGAFCVNILSSDQEDVARAFAGLDGRKGPERFDGASWERLSTGSPVLIHALAALDCRLERIVAHNSHLLLIGHVEAIRLAEGEPLLYWQGDFRRLKLDSPALS